MISAGSLRHAVRLGVRGLAAHRLRSGLTALGIVLGVASVIVMLAVGEAARYQALKQLQDLGANTIVLKSTKPTEPPKEGGGADMFAYGITYADLDRIRTNLPTVTAATPMREFRKNVWYQERKHELRMVSVTPDFLTQNNIAVLRGRGIESQDEAEYASVAVLGESAADALFPGLDPIGRTVLVEGGISDPIPFRVVGVTADKVLATGGASGDAAEFSKVIFVPFATDRVRLGRDIVSFKSGFNIERLDVSQVTVTVDAVANVPKTADALRSLIDQYHKQKDVQVLVPLDLLRKAEETQRMFTLILGAIAGISLVVGGIGIMNIMLATVTERTREIGIRRALGAKQKDIATQFLVETLVLSCGGGLIGVLLGVAAAYGLRKVVNIPTAIEGWSLAVAFGVSLLVGLLSGMYPARRAARLDPIEALRHS
jgi:putative ABC transport system permease protein